MIVTLKPPGREEYALELDGPPSYSSALPGGYEQAQVPTQLGTDLRADALGGRLRIHSETGITWQGIVTRRPARGEPLVALGWGWCATLQRREVAFCDTSISEWKPRTSKTTSQIMKAESTDAGLTLLLESGVATGTKNNGFWRSFPATSTSRVTFDWARPSTTFRLRLYSGTIGAGGTAGGDEVDSGWTQRWEQVSGAGSLTGSASVDIAVSHDTLLLFAQPSSTYTPGSDEVITWTNVKIYGSAVTTCNIGNVLANIMDNEIAASYLPAGAAHRAWLSADSTVIEPLVFDSSSAAAKIEEIGKYSAFDYGWWMEMVAGSPACVPHWTARSTTPQLIIRLDEAESYDLDESSLDELVSAARVLYESPTGRPIWTDRTDTDTTHPLVALGIIRYGDLTVQTSSTSSASTLGDLYLAENGRQQTKGSVTTRVVRSVNGAELYLPDIRPGWVARVMGLPDGFRDVVVRRSSLVGDDLVTLELDNEPYRLAIALSQIDKRQQK